MPKLSLLLLALAALAAQAPLHAAPVDAPALQGATAETAPVEFRVGREALRRGDLDEAERRFLKARRIDPQASDPLLGLADLALRRNDLPGAGRHLETALAVAPDMPEVHSAWARYLTLAQRYDEAIAAYGKAIALQPEAAPPRILLADLYLGPKNDAAKASEWYLSAIEADKGSAAAQYGLGLSLLRLDRPEDAKKAFEASAALSPGNLQPKVQLGAVATRLGDHQAALSAYTEALQIKGDHLPALLGRGDALRNLGRLELAQDAYEGVLKQQADAVPALMGLGVVHQLAKKLDPAEQVWRKVLALQPDNVVALNNLAWTLAERKKDLDEALAKAKRAIALGGDNDALRSTLGWVHRARGELPLAIAQYEPLVQKDPGADTLYELATVYLEAFKYREAAQTLERVLKLDPRHAGARASYEKVKGWR